MNNKFILLDLDETVIDTKYQLNCPSAFWKKTVGRTEARGADIGLNSDTPLITLQKWAREFGLHGPLIAERGAVVSMNHREQRVCVTPPTLEFSGFRLKAMSSLLPLASTGRLLIVTGDVNEFSNCMPRMSKRACGAELAVFINGLRMYSFSCFVRKRKGNRWVKDSAALDEIIAVLCKAGKSFRTLWRMRDIDRNPDYGFFGIHHQMTKKARAVQYLLSQAGGRPVYMIGNSMSDWVGNDRRIVHCAVANAKDEFKARCAHIAKNDLTIGVIELMERIIDS